VLSTSGEWHIVSPEQHRLLLRGRLKSRCDAFKLASFTGRVLTPQGERSLTPGCASKLFLNKETQQLPHA
jgi:hypothetical protein